MLNTPSPPSDADHIVSLVKKKLNKRLVQVLRVAQFALLLTAINTIFMGRHEDTAVLLITGVLLFSVDWAIYKKRPTLGSAILLIVLTLMFSYLAWVGSGIRDTSMVGFCGVLIFAAMLGSKRLLAGIMLLILAVCAMITYSNITELHVNTIEPTNVFTGAIIMIVLSVIGFSVWLMAHDYRMALDHLSHENLLVHQSKLKIEIGRAHV